MFKSTEWPVTSHASMNHTLWQKCSNCRDLSSWRQQQQDWEVNGNKWSGVHPARFACWRWETSRTPTGNTPVARMKMPSVLVGNHCTTATRMESTEISSFSSCNVGLVHSCIPFFLRRHLALCERSRFSRRLSLFLLFFQR